MSFGVLRPSPTEQTPCHLQITQSNMSNQSRSHRRNPEYVHPNKRNKRSKEQRSQQGPLRPTTWTYYIYIYMCVCVCMCYIYICIHIYIYYTFHPFAAASKIQTKRPPHQAQTAPDRVLVEIPEPIRIDDPAHRLAHPVCVVIHLRQQIPKPVDRMRVETDIVSFDVQRRGREREVRNGMRLRRDQAGLNQWEKQGG